MVQKEHYCGVNDQPEYYTGSKSSSSGVTLTQTYYTFTFSNYMEDPYTELFIYGKPSSTSRLSYWMATRCVNCSSSLAWYCVTGTSGTNYLFFQGLYSTSKGANSTYYALRPVVEINLDKVTLGKTGDGESASTAFSLEAK